MNKLIIKKMTKAILTSILFSFLILWSAAANSYGSTSNFKDQLLKANDSYYEGRYEDAVKQYKRIINSKEGNWGEVHFNLGNAYFRKGELGKALFHFKKSSKILPRDGDVKYNLEYLRSKTKDKIEARPFWDPRGLFPLNKREVGTLLISFWVLFWLGSILG